MPPIKKTTNKILLSCCVLLLCMSTVNAQKKDTTFIRIKENKRSFVNGAVSESESFGFQSGAFFADFSDLNFSLKQQYGQGLRDYSYSIGASLETLQREARHFSYNSIFSYHFFPSTETTILDSITFRLKGFQLGYAIGKDVFPNVKWFDLGLYTGFSTGRFRLYKQDPGITEEFLQYRNPFFSPKVIIEPRINLRHFIFAIRAEYLIDVGKGSWRTRDGRATPLGDVRSSGFFIQAYLGVRINTQPEF
jgi:hypothetical protein